MHVCHNLAYYLPARANAETAAPLHVNLHLEHAVELCDHASDVMGRDGLITDFSAMGFAASDQSLDNICRTSRANSIKIAVRHDLTDYSPLLFHEVFEVSGRG